MIKHTLMATALATALALPAYAQQQPATNPSAGQPAAQATPGGQAASGGLAQHGDAQKAGFVQSQAPNEWRGSKIIGASVYGPDNQSIGEINDVIVDGNGTVKAAVVGVGGFLGVGQKDVAIPFQSLHVQHKPNSSSIDKITVSYSKDELKNAPKFAYYEPTGSSQTTGSNASTPNSPGTGMQK